MITFIRKTADGTLPFINADGHSLELVSKTFRRFSQIVNGGEVADTVRLHPEQVKLLTITDVLGGLKVIQDISLLPNEGVLYLGKKKLALIHNLAPVASRLLPAPALLDKSMSMKSRLLKEISDRERYISQLEDRKAKEPNLQAEIDAQIAMTGRLQMQADAIK